MTGKFREIRVIKVNKKYKERLKGVDEIKERGR